MPLPFVVGFTEHFGSNGENTAEAACLLTVKEKVSSVREEVKYSLERSDQRNNYGKKWWSDNCIQLMRDPNDKIHIDLHFL